MKVSQDELERQRCAERLRVQRDAASLAADTREARQVGFDEGLEKGLQIGRIQALLQLLQQPEMSSEELKQLPEQDLWQKEEALQQQLAGKKQATGTPPTD